jgi:phytoene dehydrogenase-like protein
MSAASDAVVIGAGINGLAAAVLLAKAGWSVTVLERNDEPGGAVRTEEVTLPGFRHDLFAMSLNAFAGSPFFAEHKDELFAHGLALASSSKPFGSVFPDGRFAGVSADPGETLASVRALSAADAEAWQRLAARFAAIAPHLFSTLSTPMPSAAAARALLRGVRALGRRWPLELARLAAQSSREFAEENFERRELHALVGSWGMHLDFAPDLPGGALFAYLNAFVFAEHGMAIGRGGARTVIDALVSLLRAHGGQLVTGAEADRVVVKGGRAAAVIAGGERYEAARAVIANLTPGALYSRLLADAGLPAQLRRSVAGYRYGPGSLVIHLAVDELPAWRAGEPLREFAYVHIGPYLEDMGLAYQQAAAGLLPAEPMLIVGQPTVADPTRAPAGKHVLWVMVRMVPARIAGDAAGEIDARDWDEAKDAYADRAIGILERYAPGLHDRILGRFVLSPADAERWNPNLVGDGLGGSHHPMQNYFLRPFPGWSRYRTPIDGLYLCGASTWPGAGTGAGSGYLLGRELTRPATMTTRARRLAGDRRRAASVR